MECGYPRCRLVYVLAAVYALFRRISHMFIFDYLVLNRFEVFLYFAYAQAHSTLSHVILTHFANCHIECNKIL